MSKESELLKKEIIEKYLCDSYYGDGCDHNCDICRKWLSDYLDDFEKEVRADAIDEYSNELFAVIERCTVNGKLDLNIDDLHNLEIIIKGLAEQMKEKKNGND